MEGDGGGGGGGGPFCCMVGNDLISVFSTTKNAKNGLFLFASHTIVSTITVHLFV